MNFDEMKALSEEQLCDSIADWKKELLKLAVAANREKKADKPHMFKKLRKQIARAHTLRNQKETA